MTNKTKQLELKLPVARLPMIELEEDRRFGQPHHGHGIEEEEVEMQVRLPKQLARVVEANPEGAKTALAYGLYELDVATFTRWSNDKPPCQGWWDVTDNKTGTLNVRWWFGGVWWAMGSDPYNESTPRIHWETFGRTYAYRGLLKMPETYPAPPYTPSMLPAGARVIVHGRPRIKWC